MRATKRGDSGIRMSLSLATEQLSQSEFGAQPVRTSRPSVRAREREFQHISPPMRSPFDITTYRRIGVAPLLRFPLSARPYIARNRGHRVEFREPGLVARRDTSVPCPQRGGDEMRRKPPASSGSSIASRIP